MNNSDLIIIGSGPGGYRAAHFAATNGLSVVIIEAKEAGGTCLNRGCIPTKTLCRNAEVVETVRKAAAFGAEASLGTIDFAKVMERKDQVVSQLRSGIELLMQTPGITFVKGTASFKDAHTVAEGDELYTAKNIIIATGSEAKMPPIEGINVPGVVTSTELLALTTLPRRLCIIGAGVIGMEFASIFSSLGSEVKVIEFLKECLPTLDSDIAKRLRQAISKRGVDFSMQSGVKSIREENAEDGSRQFVVTFEKKGKASEVSADIVLVATGRRAVVEGLDLEAAGIECGRTGIVVDDNFQTNVEGVYAIGDVNGRCMLAHAATFQGLHVVRRILGKEDNIRFDIMPSAIFTTPEAASVGKSEDNRKDAGTEYVCRKGVIGMEFASIFSSLGSEVKVIEFLKECLPTLDSDIAKRLRQAISKRGVDFSMQSGVKSIREENAEDGSRQFVVTFEKKGKASEVSADIVLVATGRRAVVEGLDLEAAGIECGRTGIVVDDNFQTNVEGVYAIGDVNGRCMLAHAATFQGLHVVRRILGKEDNIRFDIMPSAIFTTPEAASVGKSEDNLKDAGTEYVCRKGFYRSNGKALAMDATDGMIKLFVTPEDGRILGCHAYGAHSSDIIQEVAALMNKDATVSELADIIHTHPTLSEVLHDISL